MTAMPSGGEDIPHRRGNDALVADRPGRATAYAIDHLEPRGVRSLGPGEAVYEGQIVGEHARETDLDVYITKENKLTLARRPWAATASFS